MLTSLQETKNTARYKANRKALLIAAPLLIVLLTSWGLYFRHQYIRQLEQDTEQARIIIETIFHRAENIATSSMALLGPPCNDVKQSLRSMALTFMGVRSINLFADNTLYCSTILTNIHHKIDANRPALALAEKSSLTDGEVPRINFIKRQGDDGVFLSLSAEHLVSSLKLSKTIDNKENFQLVIGDKWFFNDQIGTGSHQVDALFTVTLDSKEYPFTISNGHTRTEFYQSLKNHWMEVFFITFFVVAFGLIIQRLHYKHLLQKAFNILSRAIEQQAIEPYVQPIVNANDGSWLGVEVLARWKDPESQKFISPEIFIPLAEHSHLIIPMTSSFMTQVADCLVPLQAALPHGFKVSLNISARNCSNHTLLYDCINFLKRFDTHKVVLALELIERDFIEINDFTIKLFAELRQNSVQIVLDDFGTKYSNLSYFDKFNIDYFKIDPSFTTKLDSVPMTRILIDNMLDLATNLQMPIVVEGIETESQRDYFLARGIYQQQGYLFSKPMSLESFAKYFANPNVSKTP